MSEYIYILSNPSMPNLIKVGKTTKHPSKRMSELHSTGVPTPFELEFSAMVDNCGFSELAAHRALANYRVTGKREFFRISVKKAIELRDNFLGGWEKVVVLGWNFAYDISSAINELNDSKLEVLVIPPDLLDKLKSKATYKKLVDSGKIRFSSLQYLTIKPIEKINYSDELEELNISLDNYILLSPDNIPLDDADKKSLQELMTSDPLALIEYWSIDPDFDGVTFRSKWQDYRENTANDSDPLHVIYSAKIMVPKKDKRVVCVKAVDVFGFESMVKEEI
mgnify:CR=1 FL=1